jgi:hypothetical protein
MSMNHLKRLFGLASLLLVLDAIAADTNHPDLRAAVEATLIGRAVLPAGTFADGPTSGTRLGNGPIHGVRVPFINKQPVQGFSAVLANHDGSFLVMSDNGFGGLTNSPDYHLRVYTIRPDFKTEQQGSGKIVVDGFIELTDPNHQISFAIINQFTSKRVLTGADFDIESFQKAPDGTFWFGDEFGPFLLHTDAQGILLEPPIPLPDFENPGQQIRSPQNPFRDQPFRAKGSGGFEGMAMTPGGERLITLLEKPLHGHDFLLMHEFDIAKRQYTGIRYRYRLSPTATAIGDFVLFAPKQGLVIERDNSQGSMTGFKMIYQVTLKANGEWVEKMPLVNLLRIADPNGISDGDAGDVGIGKNFGLPFVTIEGLVVLGANQIGVLNDNNYPFSVGRHVGTGQPDDNEFVVIELDDRLF